MAQPRPPAKPDVVTFADMHDLVAARVRDLVIWVGSLEQEGDADILAAKRRELLVNRKLLTLIERVMGDRVVVDRLRSAGK